MWFAIFSIQWAAKIFALIIMTSQAHAVNASWSFTKTASPTTYTAAGQDITYFYTLTNTGSILIDLISVTDNRIGNVSCPSNSLAPATTMTCTGIYTTTSADVSAGIVNNQATAEGNLCGGDGEGGECTITETAQATITFLGQPSWTLSKNADPTTYSGAGQTINYSYLLTNTGNVSISAISLSDNRIATVNCPSSTLAVGANMTCTGSYATTDADVTAASVTNTATATGTPARGTLAPVSAQATITYEAPPAGSLTIVKNTVGGDGSFEFRASGSENFTRSISTSNGFGTTGIFSVKVGTVTLAERSTPGFSLTALSCAGGKPSVDLQRRQVTITVTSGANIVCTFTNTGQGVITIRKVAIGEDETFRFVSGNRAIADFSLRTSGGSAERVVTNAPAGSYAITERVAQGWRLTSLVCSGGRATTDLANATATFTLAFGDRVECTFTNTETRTRTRRIIRNFMARRGDLLTNDTGRPRLVERLQNVGSVSGDSSSAMRLGGAGDSGSGRFTFATSLAQARALSERRQREKMAKLGIMPASPIASTAERRTPRPGFDAWLEGSYTFFDHSANGQNSSGDFGLFRIGADYLVRPWLLFGALVQYDRLSERSSSVGYEIDGRGWMAGPYAEFRLHENLILDVKGLWGPSQNTISPFMTYTDSFDSTRWLVAARLTGTWVHDNWHFTPRAQLIGYQDRAESYVDSNGTYIAGQTLTLGRAIVGPEVSYKHTSNHGTLVEPRLALQGLWTFSQDTSGLGGGGAFSYHRIDPFRVRIEGGIKFEDRFGTRLELSGAYEGLGDSNLTATTGKVQFTAPF